MAFTPITVTRRYLTAELTPATGTVRMTPTAPMVNGDTVVASSRVGTLDAEGDLTLVVAANNDPATTPPGVSYEVLEQIDGQQSRSYYVTVPYDAPGGAVPLAGLNVAQDPPVVTYPAPGPQGPMGATGAQGPAGEAGAAGPNTIATASDLATTGAAAGRLLAVAGVGPLSFALNDPAGLPVSTAAQTALNGKTALSVNGAFAPTYNIDTTPVTFADVGAASAKGVGAGTSLWAAGNVETMHRVGLQNSYSLGTGVLWLGFFYAPVAATIGRLGMSVGSVASAGLTLGRMALFTVAADDSITKVAQTANDTTIGGVTFANTTFALATAGGFPSTYTLAAGTRYAIGILQVGTTTSTLRGADMGTGHTVAPVVSRQASGQADIAASYAIGAIGAHFQAVWMFGTP